MSWVVKFLCVGHTRGLNNIRSNILSFLYFVNSHAFLLSIFMIVILKNQYIYLLHNMYLVLYKYIAHWEFKLNKQIFNPSRTLFF